ncbi:hypothetical protein [Ruegeria arenilitoris]|uniref:hypothetical protein n=1 Tax=Ruegeria arenilitoris TaxID=1173585 RepID=UPI00147E9EE0|nr:hypothetical protein [Ruegeria arenilitoris]
MEELLTEVARSSRCGNHIFVLQRKLAKFASEQECLADLHRAEFRKLSQAAAQNFSLLSKAAGYVEIKIGDQFQTNTRENSWTVGHRKLLHGRLLEKPRLILEDAHSDGEVYALVLGKGTVVGREMQIEFDACHGGGNQTFRRLREQVQAGAVSICICDNDMLAPGSARSETFNKAETEANKCEFVGGFFNPPYREIENLIPIEILRECYPRVSPKRLDKLQKLIADQDEVEQGDCLWLYFDVKEGVEGEKLIEKCPNSASQNWLASKYTNGDIGCLTDVSFPGFGDSVVSTLLDSGPALKEFHKFLRSDYWAQHLQPFFEQIAWYLVGEKKARI